MNRDARETTRLDKSFLEAIIEDLTDEEESEAMRLHLENHRQQAGTLLGS
jgi:hypothetical protein